LGILQQRKIPTATIGNCLWHLFFPQLAGVAAVDINCHFNHVLMEWRIPKVQVGYAVEKDD